MPGGEAISFRSRKGCCAVAELLLDAFGRRRRAGLEGVEIEGMAFGGGPVALGEESVRKDAGQFGRASGGSRGDKIASVWT